MRRLMAALAAALMIPIAAAPARASEHPVVSGFELSTTDTLSPGGIFGLGLGGRVLLGSPADSANRSGQLHLDFGELIAPENPTAPDSPTKLSPSWLGGAQVSFWKDGALGVALDHFEDPSAALKSVGVQFSLSQGPARIAYRNARNDLMTPFEVFSPSLGEFVTLNGAFIYQQTLNLDAELRLGASDTLLPRVSYSWYGPDVASFMSLLNNEFLLLISDFQATLQSLERGNFGLEWGHSWSERLETSLSGRFIQLMIPGNPVVEAGAGVGYAFSSSLYARLDFLHLRDTESFKQSQLSLELRFLWQRASRLSSQDLEWLSEPE